MIVIYYYEFKADPEHIRVIGWEKGDLPMSKEVCCWLEPSMLLLFHQPFWLKATSVF